MINLIKYIQIMVGAFILDYVNIADEIVYINPAIYARLKEQLGESTVDNFIHTISGKEYAGFIGITTERDDWHKWHEETHTYSQRYVQEDGSFLIGAG